MVPGTGRRNPITTLPGEMSAPPSQPPRVECLNRPGGKTRFELFVHSEVVKNTYGVRLAPAARRSGLIRRLFEAPL